MAMEAWRLSKHQGNLVSRGERPAQEPCNLRDPMQPLQLHYSASAWIDLPTPRCFASLKKSKGGLLFDQCSKSSKWIWTLACDLALVLSPTLLHINQSFFPRGFSFVEVPEAGELAKQQTVGETETGGDRRLEIWFWMNPENWCLLRYHLLMFFKHWVQEVKWQAEIILITL